MSKALKVWEQVIANNNRNDDLIEQFYFLCKEEAKEEVEERIIKLLEGIAVTTPQNEVAVMELLSFIKVLIKGENK